MPAARQGTSRGEIAALVTALLLFAGGCSSPPTAGLASTDDNSENDQTPFFRDVTAACGLDFTYRNGEEAGQYTMLEVVGGGLAAFDFDGDGRLDLFVPGGGYFDGPDKTRIKGHACKLYRNVHDSAAPAGFRFEDVTARMGLDGIDFYTHGAAVGDFDNDGWPDLLVTGWGRLALFHNRPVDPNEPSRGRTFVNVSKQAGLPDGLWTTSAAWGDLDGDGFADLYVCQYVDWSFEHNHPTSCNLDGKTRDVCPPKLFKGLEHKLFRNRGDGTFAEIGKVAGLRVARTAAELEQLDWLSAHAKQRLREASSSLGGFGAGLGVVMVDVNGDGKPDIYVANDMRDNYLYINRTRQGGAIHLEERGLESGTALGVSGQPDASMGVDAADYDGSGRPSLWVTNYAGELHALYRNECRAGREQFQHASMPAGIAAAGRNTVGWGTGFLDVRHKGREDIFFTAGDAYTHSPTVPRAQKAGLLENLGGGKFADVSPRGGRAFQKPRVGRGAVLADFDNDGRVDLALSPLNGPLTLLRNEADTSGHHWLGVELAGADHRDVVGARIVLEADGRAQTRFAKGGGSYLSSGDRRHVFGLGRQRIEKLSVIWPSGKEQHWSNLRVDRYWRLTEGRQQPLELPPAGS